MEKMEAIKVSADSWKEFLAHRADATAHSRKADGLRKSFGLPEATDQTVGEYVIANLNNEPIGKYTIAPRTGYAVSDGFVGKLS